MYRSLAVSALVLGVTIAGVATSRLQSQVPTPSPTLLRDCDDVCPALVVVDPGAFEMGSDDAAGPKDPLSGLAYSAPRHTVSIRKRFAIGQYDVTRAEFSAFVAQTGNAPERDCRKVATADRTLGPLKVEHGDWQDPGYAQTDHDPVVCVNWDDIQKYLEWLSNRSGHRYRLSSEAEWEYAALGRDIDSKAWMGTASVACRYANVADAALSRERQSSNPNAYFDCDDGYPFTSPVGTFRPNALGLYDMLGNVLQVTQDCWNYNYRGAPADGSPWLTGDCVVRATRGSSFHSRRERTVSSDRSSTPRMVRSDDTGFRVARDL